MTAEIGVFSPGTTDKIGERNCLVLTYQKEREATIYGLVVDCGMKIPGGSLDASGQYRQERLTPEHYPDFKQMEGIKIVGVLITHKHIDHVGALGEFLKLYDVPGMCSPSTLTFVKGSRSLLPRGTNSLKKWTTDKNVTFGPFEITSFPVLHSTDGSLGFVISAGGVNVVFSGDIKTPTTLSATEAVLDRYRMYMRALKDVGAMKIHTLVLDSTNSDEPGYAGIEEDVVPVIERIIGENPGGRVYLSSFSSLEERSRNSIREAHRQGREVYVAGSSLQTMLELSGIRGWKPLYRKTFGNMPDDCVILCTGHQGEPNAFLAKLAREGLGYGLDIRPSDALALLADTIPLPELQTQVQEMVLVLSEPGFFRKIYLTPDTPRIVSRGAEIVYVDGHVTGHGKEENLRSVLRIIKPRYLIPYHGTLPKKERLGEIAARLGIGILELVENETLVLPQAREEIQKARQA